MANVMQVIEQLTAYLRLGAGSRENSVRIERLSARVYEVVAREICE